MSHRKVRHRNSDLGWKTDTTMENTNSYFEKKLQN